MNVLVISAPMSLDLEQSFRKSKVSLDLETATLMIGGRCPDQVDLAYIVSTYEENSAKNHPFLKVHLISFDSMYNMCNLKFK